MPYLNNFRRRPSRAPEGEAPVSYQQTDALIRMTAQSISNSIKDSYSKLEGVSRELVTQLKDAPSLSHFIKARLNSTFSKANPIDLSGDTAIGDNFEN